MERERERKTGCVCETEAEREEETPGCVCETEAEREKESHGGVTMKSVTAQATVCGAEMFAVGDDVVFSEVITARVTASQGESRKGHGEVTA